jgi:cation diffusion facilitator CzcD-associated flavoprotein CzcO
MPERLAVAVIGVGQVGLATRHHLGIEHVVFERGLAGETWHSGWDSFTFVAPCWTAQLPEHPL